MAESNVNGLHNTGVNVAKLIVGLETDAHIMDMRGEDMTAQHAKDKFNQQVDDYVEKLDKHSKMLEDYAESLADDLNGVECMPLYEGIIVKPFEENPFQRIKREGNLIVDTGGLQPIYKSHEDGEWHEEEQFMKVGVVIEAGPTCRYVKSGDIVMYPKNSAVPIPFYKQGWYRTTERAVFAVFNTGLNERFKLNDGK